MKRNYVIADIYSDPETPKKYMVFYVFEKAADRPGDLNDKTNNYLIGYTDKFNINLATRFRSKNEAEYVMSLRKRDIVFPGHVNYKPTSYPRFKDTKQSILSYQDALIQIEECKKINKLIDNEIYYIVLVPGLDQNKDDEYMNVHLYVEPHAYNLSTGAPGENYGLYWEGTVEDATSYSEIEVKVVHKFIEKLYPDIIPELRIMTYQEIRESYRDKVRFYYIPTRINL